MQCQFNETFISIILTWYSEENFLHQLNPEVPRKENGGSFLEGRAGELANLLWVVPVYMLISLHSEEVNAHWYHNSPIPSGWWGGGPDDLHPLLGAIESKRWATSPPTFATTAQSAKHYLCRCISSTKETHPRVEWTWQCDIFVERHLGRSDVARQTVTDRQTHSSN